MPILTDTLLIIRNFGQEGNFTLRFSICGDKKLSDGYYTFDGANAEIFQIEKFNAGAYPDTLWQNVTMRDDSSGVTGVPYGATSANDLDNKLRILKFLRPKNASNGTGVQTIVAGTNVTVDNTDPENPIVSAAGGGSGYSSFQQMYDADPANTQITDGNGTLVTSPTVVANFSTLADGETLEHSIADLATGASAGMRVENNGGNINANVGAADGSGKAAQITGDGTLRVNSNGVFSAILKSDNLTDQQEIQAPDGNGTLGLSVKVAGVSYPFNTDGETDDIPAGTVDLSAYVKGDGTQATDVDLNGKSLLNVDAIQANDVDANTFNGGTLMGDNSGDDAPNSTANTYADSKVIDSIADADTTHAPSRNAVFDALALKQPLLVNSAGLLAALSDETGTGLAVFNNAPTLVNPVVGTQSANDNSTKAASTAYVDAKVIDSIADADTTHAPSRNSVFDALALKADDSNTVHKTGNETIGGTKIFSLAPILTPEASPAYVAGKLTYDSDNECLTFFNDDSAVGLQIGQEQWIRVRNVSGSTIANGAAVYINGSNSGRPTIALAKADAAATTVCVGIATESIANNATGYITTMGLVRDLNTSGFSVGAVYLSATTAGLLTQTAPTAPNYRMRVGFVTTVNASTGTIHITPSTAALGNGTSGQYLVINASGIQEWQTPAYPKKNNVDSTTLTTTAATETILHTFAITGGDFIAGSSDAYVCANFKKVGTAGACTLKFYVAPNSGNLTGASQVGMVNIAAANVAFGFERTIYFKSGNLLDVFTPTQTSTTDKNLSATAKSPISFDPSVNFYIHVVGSIANGADALTCTSSLLERK